MIAWHLKPLRTLLGALVALTLVVLPFGLGPLSRAQADNYSTSYFNCAGGAHVNLCTEVYDPKAFHTYVGHDEPSALFYSDTPGSGNSNYYELRLPADAPKPPVQGGGGGIDNFMLHPAFWFGMAMCDTQSAPNFVHTCTPDSDSNIHEGLNPQDSSYIGYHPGTAFMEMQFYPPGWAPFQLPGGLSCSATQWCAALNIDSYQQDMNTGQYNNNDCLTKAGVEPVNFAFITKNGVAQAPADPLRATAATYTPDPSKDLFMSSGDEVTVTMHDTAAGFQVVIHDLTNGEQGAMTASVANQFGHPVFQPNASTCQDQLYAFHPMYTTSSPQTRVPWAAHSYNVAFSDEIGHFQYCRTVNFSSTPYPDECTSGGDGDPTVDDYYCLPASYSTHYAIGGCVGTDVEFDGVPYRATWPGTFTDTTLDQAYHPQPILFTSPLFNGVHNYSRVAFETDLPRIEDPLFSPNNDCNRTTGSGCVNPPRGAQFYPIYSTRSYPFAVQTTPNNCKWQLGGPYIPGTVNDFGGSSPTEYGTTPLKLYYPDTGLKPIGLYEDFRTILSSNPCPS